MPELPEVESFRRMLLPLASQATPLKLELVKENPPRQFLSQKEVDDINNNNYTVKDVRRKGKLICMELTTTTTTTAAEASTKSRPTPITKFLNVHMGMTGRITRPDKVPT
jgi:formamidopyrimidine-DNA glycosylase